MEWKFSFSSRALDNAGSGVLEAQTTGDTATVHWVEAHVFVAGGLHSAIFKCESCIGLKKMHMGNTSSKK